MKMRVNIDRFVGTKVVLTIMVSGMCSSAALAQDADVNYDESKVKVENLPDMLVNASGKKIDSSSQWDAQRKYLVNQIAEYQFGFAPTEAVDVKWAVAKEGTLKDSKIRFREIDITLKRADKEHRMWLVLFLPASDAQIHGCFLMPNFQGNHALTSDPQLRITETWMRDIKDSGNVNNKATEASRGKESQRAPIELITGRGYVLASIYYGDIDPDFDDDFKNGVHALFPEYKCDAEHPNRWGTIAGWSWGVSRCADVILQQKEIPKEHLAVIGHSRLGKTALWAGATDPRFTLVIANESGEGGAALSRRNYGETVKKITTMFPHWFNDNYPKYGDDPSKLPVDAHMLVASIAPRPVYVASATNDRWADPKGEFTSAYLAGEAYHLLGKKGIESNLMPAENVSVGDCVGYHCRPGDHNLLDVDWKHYLDFTDRHWK